MGCQVDVAQAVRDQRGDYMLAIKDNQPTLHRETQETPCNSKESSD